MTDNDNTFQTNEVRYNFNSGTPDLFTWGGGKITVNDMGIVRSIAANDRLDQIPAIDLKTTGGGQNGIVFLQSDASRHTVRTGTVTLYDNYVISTESSSFGPGSTSGFHLGSGTGTGGLNNQGLYDVRFSGDGIVSLGDNSASFTGAHTIGIGDATVRVLHNGAFGAATATATVNSTGVIEIATANFSPTATLVQSAGSIERWARSDARGTGNFTFANGVHWQVFTDVTGTRTIDLAGGSIMGYLPLDYDEVAAIQTIRSSVTVNLTANSYLGQIYPAGTSNGSNHFIYDMGKLNTSTNLNPSDVGLRGSYLVIDGNITGSFGLTKVGQDVIKLAGSNTFPSLSIEDGIIQLGKDYALSTTVALSTRGAGQSGILDLNGYNQEIGSLTGPSGSINNSAFENKTLTVNQTASTIYGGTIGGSVTVTKDGAGTLTFTGVNDYQGGTNLNGGTISVSQDTSLGRVHLTTRADSLRFNGGTLQTTASFSIPAVRGLTLDSSGGTIETSGAITTQMDSIITGAGSLTKTGVGTLQLNHASNDYTGATNVSAGTLQSGVADSLAPLSRHIVTGDAISGTLATVGLDQTIGSLASTGGTQASATVSIGAGILTVGNDRTQDAVYAGTITGAGTFRVNGSGAVQTLSAADNSAQAWSTQIANGVLNVADNGRLGSGGVTLGVVSVSGADDLTVLNLQNTSSVTNNITVANVNSVGSAFITSNGSSGTISGTVILDRNIYAGAATGTTLSLTNAVTGNGTITFVDGGSLRLTASNTYGSGVAGTSGTPVSGGTVLRAGTLLLENNTGAGSGTIALGDSTSTIGAAVDRATFSSILGSGTFNPNGDGVSAASGGQNAAGTTGFGAFIGVSSNVDGNTYTSGNVGTRLLIAGEEANPERNGIYIIVSVSGSTMNLVRADDYETGSQIKYGGQVAVTNGTYAGQTMFQFEEQVVVRNETTLEPIRFRADVANPNVAALVNVTGLTVANNIDILATNGTGTTTVGGSVSLSGASDTGTFSGNIRLIDVQAGVAETRTLQLTSAITGGSGIQFSGVMSEVDTTAGTGDTLAVTKIGAGIVSLSGASTYRGGTTVTAGTLLANNTSGSATGSGAVTVNGSTILGGTGIIAPASNNSITITGTIAAGLVGASSGGDLTLNLSGTGNLVLNGTASFDIFSRIAGVNPATAADRLIISAADWANIVFGGSSVLDVIDTTATSTAWLSGDSWQLFDWSGIATGTPGNFASLNLPALGSGLFWDTSALYSTGYISITGVPEPSRALLLLMGMLGLMLRRRRRD